MFTRFSLRDYNFKLLITVIIAMICGVVMINSADSSFTPKQTIGIGLGVIIMIFVSLLNYDFVCRFYRVFFIINAVILLSVIFFGVEVNYAKRWIMIGGSGGIQFQPSEFSKILMILFTATFLDKLKEDNKINTLKGLCLFVLLIGLSLALIAVEPDLSTTLCLAMVLVTMLYLSGLSYKIIGIALLVFVPLAGSFLWYIQRPNQHLLRDYQVNRILQFIYPGQYGSDYTQQNNSVMAIGSGQLTGKGLNTSTIATVKDANFISEQQTDFIFSVIGEELGFVGSVIIIAILLLIVLQCSEKCKRYKRHADCSRNGLSDRIPDIHQCRCCNRCYTKHRTTASVYQLRAQFPDQYLDWNRSRAKCQYAKNKLLGKTIMLLKENRT